MAISKTLRTRSFRPKIESLESREVFSGSPWLSQPRGLEIPTSLSAPPLDAELGGTTTWSAQTPSSSRGIIAILIGL